jgi:hypothetical protein
MPDIIITPSTGKLEFVDNSAQNIRKHAFSMDVDGLSLDAPLAATSIKAPVNIINVTVNNSNVNYPFILASGSAETGTKTLMMDGSGGTYNPFTNTATIDISGNAATVTNGAYLNVAQTFTATATFAVPSRTTSYTTPSIQVYTGDNTPPGIAFHRGGVSATYLYESGGELYTNPWTAVGQTGKLLAAGNYTDYTVTKTGTGASGNWTITSSWATNALTATNSTQLNGQAASYYTDIVSRLGYTPVNKAGDTVTGNLTVNGNFAVNGSVTAFSASNIYITSSTLIVTDNIITMNALSPYQRYAGIQMYDTGSGTLSNFLWDGDGDYFFLSGSSVNGKIITGPDGQTNLTANYVPKATAGYKLGNSLIYDNGTNVGIGTTNPSAKLDIYISRTSSTNGIALLLNDNVTGAQTDGVYKSIRSVSNGGNSISEIRFLETDGTNNNTGISFATANVAGGLTERMRVGPSGNVGIGTTSPSGKLEIRTDAASTYIFSGSSTSGYATTFTMDDTASYFGHDSSVRSLILRTNSTARLTVKGDGNVGIGTTSPAYTLDVSGTIRSKSGTTGTLYLGQTSGGTTYVAAALIGTPSATYNPVGKLSIQLPTHGVGTDYGLTEQMSIQVNTSDSKAATMLLLPYGGSVGIGTSSPANRFEVVGSTFNRASFIATANVQTGIQIQRTGGVSNTNWEIYSPASSGDLRINNVADYVTFKSGSGWVGIGTTSPADKLQVGAGHISIDAGYKYYMDANVGAVAIRKDGTSMVFTVGATDKVYINESGNVGIGTSSPSSKLHIDDATAPYITITRAGVPTWQLRNNFPSNQYGFSFNNTTAGTVPLFIGTGGNIGIGLDSPAAKLDIVGTNSTIALSFGTTVANNPLFINTYGSNTGIGMDQATAGLRLAGDYGGGSNPLVDIGYYSGGTVSHANWISKFKILNSGVTNFAANVYHSIGGQKFFAGSGGTHAYIYTGTTAFNFINSSDSSTLVTILNGGNVGIGTTVPGAKLQINNVSDSRLIVYETGTSPYTATLELSSQVLGTYGATVQYTSNAETLTIQNYGRSSASTTQGGILFRTKLNNTTATDVMVINGFSGNVGIGTTSPVARLTVTPSGSAFDSSNTMVAYFGKTTANGYGSTFIRVARSDSTTTTGSNAEYTDIEHNSGGATPFRYGTYSDTNIINGGAATNGVYGSINFVTSGSTRMTIAGGTSAGNVGIGTTSPGYKLDVNGTFRTATNNLTIFNDYLYVSPTQNNTLNSAYFTNGIADMWINYAGYNNGNTQFRNFNVGDGKNGIVAWFDGTNKRVSINNSQTANYTLEVNGIIGLYGASNNHRRLAQPSVWGYSSTYRTIILGSTSTTANVADGAVTLCFGVDVSANANGSFQGDGRELVFRNLTRFVTPNAANTSYLNPLTFNNGDVGIGTDSPVAKFEMFGGEMAIKLSANTTSSFQWKNSSGTKIQEIRYDDSDGSMTLGGVGGYPIKFITSNSEKVRISGTGNLGIGTTSPATLLHVDTAGSDARIRVSAGTNTVQGGMIANTGTSLVYAGSVTNHGFSLRTNDTDRVRIQTDGNVGIGTTGPSARLHVFDTNNSPATGNLLVTSTGGNASIRIDSNSTANYTYFTLSQGGAGKFELGIVPTTSDLYINPTVQSGPTGAAIYIKKADGNVGIGLTSPGYKLDVNGTGYFSSTLQVNSNITVSGGGDVVINDSDGTGFFASFMDSGVGYIRIDDGGSGNGKLNINNGLVYIQGAGNNVGIGSTSPGHKLDVNGTFNATGTSTLAAVSISGTINSSATEAIRINNNNGYISIYNTAGTTRTGYIQGLTANSLTIAAENSSILQFNVGGSERVRIDTAGNVGIGTTSAGKKLDVEGVVRTRGATGTGGFEIGAATTGTAKWRIEWDSASDSLDFNWVG